MQKAVYTHRGAKAFIKLHLWLYRAVKRRRIINAQGFKQTRGLSLAWMWCGLVQVCIRRCGCVYVCVRAMAVV